MTRKKADGRQTRSSAERSYCTMGAIPPWMKPSLMFLHISLDILALIVDCWIITVGKAMGWEGRKDGRKARGGGRDFYRPRLKTKQVCGGGSNEASLGM